MTLRSVLAKHTGIVRAEDKVEMEGLEASLNEIELNKVKIIRRKDRLTIEEYTSSLENINITKLETQNRLEILRNKLDKQKQFESSANWYEYGENRISSFLILPNLNPSKKSLTK
jgi:tRNA U34 5-carboxymethylaminomethyl modifying GTPase MnmE/TrmE